TDPRGITTTYAYQYGAGRGDLMEIAYADGTTDQYQYDPNFHQQTYHEDRAGNVTTSTYDESTGDLLTSTLTGPHTSFAETTTNVWSNGLLMRTTDPDGNSMVYQYDGARRMTEEDDYDAGGALIDVSTFTYDAAGNPATSTVGVGGSDPEPT